MGKIEVITGCMFCGKSEELIRRCKRALIAKKQVKVFKPNIDDRWDKKELVVSRYGVDIPALLIDIDKPDEILNLIQEAKVVAIDEAQFFGKEIVDVCRKMSQDGIRVIVSGLDMDYRGEPFGYMPQLMAIANKVDKLTAICTQCGEEANMTQKLTNSKQLIEVGDSEYTARCQKCHYVP